MPCTSNLSTELTKCIFRNTRLTELTDFASSTSYKPQATISTQSLLNNN
uniref:Uncharacterized protein n=1 Tax=Arundo donax TaxID=35708 RepID=A0A0A9B913_ARUDO